MATKRLYLTDTTCRRFEANVIDHCDGGVVLDRTAFYSRGGGQPSDIGEFTVGDRTWNVSEVRGRDPIVHVVDGALPPVGSRVAGEIDWPRRHAHMRYHTAQHLLSAVLLDDYDAPTTGNQLYADRARLDCEYERFSDAELAEIEERVDELVRADLPVEWYTLAREDAEETLDPSRTRLDLLPASVRTVRIVEIGDVDRTACAGTHVANTAAIGRFELTGRETAGRGCERIRLRLADPS